MALNLEESLNVVQHQVKENVVKLAQAYHLHRRFHQRFILIIQFVPLQLVQCDRSLSSIHNRLEPFEILVKHVDAVAHLKVEACFHANSKTTFFLRALFCCFVEQGI